MPDEMHDAQHEAAAQSAESESSMTSGRSAPKTERPEIAIARLEQLKALLSERCRQIQLELVRRMRLAQERQADANGLRQELARLKSEENGAREELAFLEEEKQAQEQALASFAAALRLNLADIEKNAREIEFMKGEIGALRQHVAAFKEKLPDKYTDVSYLEGKISQTEQGFRDLFERLKLVGKDLDLGYYQKKQTLRRKYVPF